MCRICDKDADLVNSFWSQKLNVSLAHFGAASTGKNMTASPPTALAT
jgi:hypothetical protein